MCYSGKFFFPVIFTTTRRGFSKFPSHVLFLSPSEIVSWQQFPRRLRLVFLAVLVYLNKDVMEHPTSNYGLGVARGENSIPQAGRELCSMAFSKSFPKRKKKKGFLSLLVYRRYPFDGNDIGAIRKLARLSHLRPRRNGQLYFIFSEEKSTCVASLYLLLRLYVTESR